MKTQKLRQVYLKFEQAEGNQYIASEFAVEKLIELLAWFSPNRILEVGLGISSISGPILSTIKNENLSYSGTENNSFCLNALKTNLAANFNKLKIFGEIKDIPENTKFDLIIIDGKDHSLKEIKKLISSNGIIAIEGDRSSQQEILSQLFPSHKTVHSISLSKNGKNSPFPKENWQGGIKIIFVNPTSKQNLWWLKERIKTKLKYQYPGRHFGKTL